MFQLLELIVTSPIGALIMNGIQDTIYALLLISDCDECGFNDLGRMLFGGLILAVLAGVAISLLVRRIKEKEGRQSNFVSIRMNSPK
jgi:hypothetical protein